MTRILEAAASTRLKRAGYRVERGQSCLMIYRPGVSVMVAIRRGTVAEDPIKELEKNVGACPN